MCRRRGPGIGTEGEKVGRRRGGCQWIDSYSDLHRGKSKLTVKSPTNSVAGSNPALGCDPSTDGNIKSALESGWFLYFFDAEDEGGEADQDEGEASTASTYRGRMEGERWIRKS